MQVARLIEPREERTLAAKLRQIARAWQIERAISKTGVLDRYLDAARPSAAMSRACAPPRSPISARSRSG